MERRRSRAIALSIFATILLVSLITTIAVSCNRKHSKKKDDEPEESAIKEGTEAHAILKAACQPTSHKDLCFSTVATHPGVHPSHITSSYSVIRITLNSTARTVHHNLLHIQNLTAWTNLTRRQSSALHDCLVSIDLTLDDIRSAMQDFSAYPEGRTSRKKTLSEHADDLKTFMSSAITNQETCIDGFSHGEEDRGVREELMKGERRAEEMCSNGLAMIRNVTEEDMGGGRFRRRGVREGWPWWERERRVLQEGGGVKADVVVAADGSGDCRTVGEAVERAPEKREERFVIRIKEGVYRENVEVGKKKWNVMFVGDGRTKTIITGRRNVADGSTTFNSATLAVVGKGFLARGVAVENTAGAAKHQAVALRVGSDLSAFYECDILGFQDTLYVHSNRQFFSNCLIVGTVDFIFGNAAALFQDCDIHARRPGAGQKNMVTAQGRTDPNQNTGIVIQKCRVGATADLKTTWSDFPTYLGRPWKEYSRTVVMQSQISEVVRPEGWHEWTGPFALATLRYIEFSNSGVGAAVGARVTWPGFRVLVNSSQAFEYTARKFFGGDNWLPSTGFPFELDL